MLTSISVLNTTGVVFIIIITKEFSELKKKNTGEATILDNVLACQ